MNTRAAALKVLIKVTEHGAYLNDTLRMYFKEIDRQTKADEKEAAARDKAFAARLCTETVKRLTELDFRINLYAKTKVKKMHPMVRNILRMGVCQLYYMDGVPASAAVNESVKLAKANGQTKASGFINGVLRSMHRNEKPYPYETSVPLDIGAFAVAYSMPEWILRRYERRFGMEKTKEIAAGFLAPAPLAIRVNTSRIAPEKLKKEIEAKGIRVEEVPGRPAAFLLADAGAVEEIPGFSEGLFFIQDLSSMEVAYAAKVKAGDTVIDVCAAPGGKALHAADLATCGHVDARDVSGAKVAKIKENIARARFSNISAKVWDATRKDADAYQTADVVIADLPCSGLGVLRRKPEIKYRLTQTDILDLAELQQRILSTVGKYVKHGGRLVFSTCTLTEEENERNTKRFLQTQEDFTLAFERTILPDACHDGFYIAVMERR